MLSSAIEPRAGYLPPLVQTDDSHQSAAIIVATAVLLFTALLFVGPRLWVRQHPDNENSEIATGNVAGVGSLLGLDDGLLVTALILYGIHAALVFSACAQGLGNTVDSLSVDGIQSVKNLYHASNAFYVLALGLSNASVSWLLVRINSSRAPLVTRSLKAIMAFLVLWTVAMVFVMLLACPTGNLAALSTDRCPNWVASLGRRSELLRDRYHGCGYLERVGLEHVVRNESSRGRIVRVKIAIIPLSAIQLANFHDGPFNADPTLNITLFVCLSELVLSYNICSANFPAFRRLTNDIRTDFGGFTIGGTFGSGLRSSQKYHADGYIRSKGSARAGREIELDTIPINDSQANRGNGKRASNGFNASALTGRHEDYTVEAIPGNADNSSVNSMAVSEHESTEMIIRTRTDIVVRSDYGAL